MRHKILVLATLSLLAVGCSNRLSGKDAFDRGGQAAVRPPVVVQKSGYYEVRFFNGDMPNEYALNRPQLASTHAVYVHTPHGVVRLPSMGAYYDVAGTEVRVFGLRDYSDGFLLQIDY